MGESLSLEELTVDLANVIPAIDAETTGQYGAGLGSETEDRQLELLLNYLRDADARYEAIEREVAVPRRRRPV